MTAKHISISLMLLFCTVVLVGQKVISESTSIVLNKGKAKQSQSVIQPKIHVISHNVDEETTFESNSETINIIGRIEDHQGIESVRINDKLVSLDGNGLFKVTLELQPGIQSIDMVAFFNNTPVEKTFNVVYNTPMMLFAKQVTNESDFHALIIGINKYSDPDIESLYRPVRDAKSIHNVLITRYTFEAYNTKLLEDPTKMDIERELDELIERVKPNDNLLIFFAGHGHWNDLSNVGYWMPADAELGSYRTYFNNSRLVDFIKEIQAKHTLVIADACFAGAIFNSRSVTKDPNKKIQELYRLPSCKAMTSGIYEQVDDVSAFTKFLIEELNENDEMAFTAVDLYSDFHNSVINNGSEPKYGNIRINKDRGGEFVFISRQD